MLQTGPFYRCYATRMSKLYYNVYDQKIRKEFLDNKTYSIEYFEQKYKMTESQRLQFMRLIRKHKAWIYKEGNYTHFGFKEEWQAQEVVEFLLSLELALQMAGVGYGKV